MHSGLDTRNGITNGIIVIIPLSKTSMTANLFRIFLLMLGSNILAAQMAMSAPMSTCSGPIRVHAIRVATAGAFGVLTLKDGRKVWLEGIRLPYGELDRAPNSFARQAFATLTLLLKNKTIDLAARSPDSDRYGRIRAQVQTAAGLLWVQEELLKQGLARVAPAPLRPECARELYAAEIEARTAKRGIWSSTAYAIRDPNTLKRDIGTFQIVQGRVVSADIKNGRAYLDFGSDWRNDFTATVSPDDMKIFRSDGFDPRSLAGKDVRLRGFVDSFHGPEIEISSPQSIEVLNTN